ncbi:unnamed protein product [Phytophthora fragariaefolia]|uniref:Unnamed protein product n=1 Tax=Phytophthora fragariaefolia TaxID=1490495 RepID=A0A9W6UF97_9STRA|nr:unnamed protein product [Phytophthora fragariaefolia]
MMERHQSILDVDAGTSKQISGASRLGDEASSSPSPSSMSALMPASKRAWSSSREKFALPRAFLYSPSDIVRLGELGVVTVEATTDVEAEELIVVATGATTESAAAGAAGTPVREAKLHMNVPRPVPRPTVKPSGVPEPVDLSSATAAGSQQRRGSKVGCCRCGHNGQYTRERPAGAGPPAGDAVERVDIGHAVSKTGAPRKNHSHCKKQDDKPNLVILKVNSKRERSLCALVDCDALEVRLATGAVVRTEKRVSLAKSVSQIRKTQIRSDLRGSRSVKGDAAVSTIADTQVEQKEPVTKDSELDPSVPGADAIGPNVKDAPPSGVEEIEARRPRELTLQEVRTVANVPHRKSLRAAGLQDEAKHNQAAIDCVRPRLDPSGEQKPVCSRPAGLS